MQRRNTIRIPFIAALIGILIVISVLRPVRVSAQTGQYEELSFDTSVSGVSTSFSTNIGSDYQVTIIGYVCHNPGDTDDVNDAIYSSANGWSSHSIDLLGGGPTYYGVLKDGSNLPVTDYNSSHGYAFTFPGTGSPFTFANNNNGYASCGGPGFDVVIDEIDGSEIPDPETSIANIYDYCPLLGADASTFTNLPGKWTGAPIPHSAEGESKGLLATNGKFSLQLTLSKDRQYVLATKFRVTDPTRTETFGIQLGASPALIIDIANTDDQQSQTIAAAHYTPDSVSGGTSYYKLQIFSQLYTMGEFSQNGDLIIDYICVADTTPQIEGENDPNKILNSAECKECVYTPVGDLFQDIPKIVEWAICVLKRLFSCVLANWLYQLGLWLGGVGKFLASWQVWGGEVLQRFLTWSGDGISSAIDWLGGFLGNVLQFILNGAIQLINWLGLGGLVNGVLDFIRNIIPTVQQAADIAGLIFQIIKYWVERAVELILSIVFAIPLIFQGVIESFNETASTIPIWAPTCNDSNTFLFGPCLGFYVMDNTVFDGPIYYVLILLCGFVAFNTLLWSLGKIKGALAET